jgi:SWI/SNF-related matrix-associated actin-dependent regulator 1 of chromatin subfamily A
VTLYPYQVEGARFLASRRRAMLADEQGLGKTAQAIEAANLVGADPVLVICPASVRSAWVHDIRQFSRGGRYVVESYDRVSRSWEDYGGPWGALVVDEAHYLKSPSARRTHAIYGGRKHFPGIAPMAGHVWALTGTPAPNYPVEMYTHMRALFPDSLAMASDPTRRYDHDAFMHRYCVLRDSGYGMKPIKAKNTEDLRARLQPYVLRRLKRDVLPDLPEIRYAPLLFDVPDAASALKDVPDEQMAAIRAAMKDGVAGLQKMAVELATLRRVTAMAKVELVRQWVTSFLDETDRKIVIFGHHIEPLEYLHFHLGEYFRAKRKLNSRHFVPMISGRTNASSRARAIERFQNDPEERVFLGQIQAAGTGITLTAASDMLFIEQSWSPADNAQAAMRIHRIGQKRGCVARYAVLAGSVDEGVQTVLARKTTELSKLFD